MVDVTDSNPKNLQKKRSVRYLFTIAIFVVLGLIVLPSLMNSPNKCCGESQRDYVGSMNRLQQAYYLNYERLASSLEELGFLTFVSPEEKEKAEKYIFLTFNFRQSAINYVIPKEKTLRTWVGGVFVTKMPQTNELTTSSIMCRAKLPGTEAIAPPINAQICGSGTEKLD
jgi:type IV pilus assembly protein PilA